MERLDPELQYNVKLQRQNVYATAFELAKHCELLSTSRSNIPSANVSNIDNLAAQVEALSV